MSGDLVTYFACTKCSAVFGVASMDRDLRLLTSKKRLPCTTTGCKGRLKKIEFTDLKKRPMVIPAAQLFAALGGGVGLPEERRRASPMLLTSRFTGVKLASIDGVKVGDKTIVSSITFDNGFTMHFGVSTKGAAIYKVTEETDGR